MELKSLTVTSAFSLKFLVLKTSVYETENGNEFHNIINYNQKLSTNRLK